MGTPSLAARPEPLITDPVHDGAADPVLVWNRHEAAWWCLFCQRRANTRLTEPSRIGRCHGTSVAVASSTDLGRSWLYRGTLDLGVERGHNTYWGHEVVEHDGVYHMYVTFIRGVPNDPTWDTHGTPSAWKRHIHHLTSRDLWTWTHESRLDLASEHVVDPCVARLPDGRWGLWYKDEERGGDIWLATSDDLASWTPAEVALSGWHEGPVVFELAGRRWLIAETRDALVAYRSGDARSWEACGALMSEPGSRPYDAGRPRQPDVVPLGDGRAALAYFVQNGTDSFGEAVPTAGQASVCRLVELRVEDDVLVCDRDAPFDLVLPDGEEPA